MTARPHKAAEVRRRRKPIPGDMRAFGSEYRQRVRDYAAFVLDPDRNRIEAVTFPAE